MERTVKEAKVFLHKNRMKGCVCEVCEQYVKMYRRKLTSSMAYGMILIYNAGQIDWFHLDKFFKSQNCATSIRGDIPKLRYWGFIEKMVAVREDGNPRAGYYRLTQKGMRFISGKIMAPTYAIIYNNKLFGMSNEDTDIRKALTNKFNYNQLMGRLL